MNVTHLRRSPSLCQSFLTFLWQLRALTLVQDELHVTPP
jgi:hypothetical protein